MKCNQEGVFAAVITVARTIKARFKDTGFEVELQFATKAGADGTVFEDSVFLDLSTNEFISKGKFMGQPRCNQAYADLAGIGLPNNGQNLGMLSSLLGKEIAVNVSKNAKGYFNCYLSNAVPAEEADAAMVMQSLGLAGAPQGQQQQQFPQQGQQQGQQQQQFGGQQGQQQFGGQQFPQQGQQGQPAQGGGYFG